MQLDLTPYFEKILDESDKPLFEEAVKSAKAGAIRGAYVLIWLSCAESFKRRFQDAKKRDGSAGKIFGEIEKKERDHKPVDKYVLDKALEYGFISDSAHNVLNHIYEMRCIYGHPYEEGPSKEQLIHAAESVVKLVLSQPVKLREGFASNILKRMLEDENYLDNTLRAVSQFAKDILPRINENLYGWFLEKIFGELENIADDPTIKIFFMRGKWFTRTLIEIGSTGILNNDQWHEMVVKFPKTSLRILTKPSIFKKIGARAQDSIVGAILNRFEEHPTALQILEVLENRKCLSLRQRERFHDRVNKSKIDNLKASGLSTSTCFEPIVNALESHNWYSQNPAAEFVLNNGAEDIEDLDHEKQEKLGRNILQAATGSSNACIKFLEQIARGDEDWPTNFIKGIALECFINELLEIRIKDAQLEHVVEIIENLDTKDLELIVEEIIEGIGKGKPKYRYFDERDFLQVKECAKNNSWLNSVYKALRKKQRPASDNE